jgi:hypothetical protein
MSFGENRYHRSVKSRFHSVRFNPLSLFLSRLADCLPYPSNNLLKATLATSLSRGGCICTRVTRRRTVRKGCERRGEQLALGGARHRDSFRFKYQKQFRHPRGWSATRPNVHAASARRTNRGRGRAGDGYYDACGTRCSPRH